MSAGAPRRWLALAVLLTLGFAALAQSPNPDPANPAPAVEATFERNPVLMGETVRLRLTLEGYSGDAAIDLAPLEPYFEVLGTSRRSQINWVNGRQSLVLQWQLELAPKVPGAIDLPALTVTTDDGIAHTSNALLLEVAPSAPADPGSAPAEPLFAEAEVTPADSYVNAQFVFSVKLFSSVELLGASLSEPMPRGADMHRLGSDSVYTAVRGGQSYRVIERRFALFPQKPGAFVVGAVELNGEVSDRRPGTGALNPFYSRGKPFRLRTDEIRLNVRPRPDGVSGTGWTPAAALEVTESWSGDTSALRAGEPVTRSIKLEATGLSGEQLPAIDFGQVDGLKQYPERAAIDTDTSRNDAVYGSRVERVAFVPAKAGRLTLPQVRIRWWDVVADAARETVVPARTINVLPPAAGTTGAPVSGVQSQTAREDLAGWAARALPWQAATAVLGALWLLTLFALYRTRTRRRDASGDDDESPRIGDARRELRFACVANDAPRARRALKAWGRAAWPHDPPRSLTALGRRLQDGPLTEALVALDRTLYAGGGTQTQDWQGAALWHSASRALVAPGRRRPSAVPALPALYPPSA